MEAWRARAGDGRKASHGRDVETTHGGLRWFACEERALQLVPPFLDTDSFWVIDECSCTPKVEGSVSDKLH